MNKIKEVKELTNIIDVANLLGLNLNRAHFCKCPFHTENTASLSVSEKKQVWKCFGCGKGGDAINLVEDLLNINAYQAAKYINDNLGLGLDFKGKNDEIKINRYKQKQIAKQQFKKWENRSFQILCDSIHKMNFVEKDQELSIIDYYLEAFICGTDEEKITYTISPTDADTDIQITWKSDNESVATVDNGTIKAVGIGKCVITATTENGKSATCDVTVIKSNNSEDDDKNNGNNGSGDKDNNNGNNGSGDEDNNNGNNDINNGNNGSNGSEENGNNGGNSGLKNNGGSDNGTKFSSSNSGVIEESYGDSTSDKDIPYTGYKVALGLGIIIAGIISTLSYIKFRKMDI